MRVLATGLTGFVGNHLAPRLVAAGHDVVTVTRTDVAETPPARTRGEAVDVWDRVGLQRLIRDHRPEAVIHLAGASSVGQSYAEPELTWKVNLWGTLALFEALRLESTLVPCLAVTSAEIHGNVSASALPVGPDTPIDPLSPYGASKAAADLLATQYRVAYGLPVIRVRAFNHIGPGQDARFVVPSVARQIAQAEAAGRDEVVLTLGNIDTKRDFTDVRDIVRAYELLLEHGDASRAYVACSGRSLAIRELVDGLASLAKIRVRVTSDASLRRAGEAPDLYGDATRLHEDTGWTPTIPLATTLADVMQWWREREGAV